VFCHVTQRTFFDLSSSIDAAAIERRLPYMCALELTYRCNQACCHCYCNRGVNDLRKADELSTQEIKRILDEAADAGCLWLLLTGGEVLVREDFGEIYLYAVKKGMLVQVFTNATLIDETAARLFAEFPPLGIDISIYGADAPVHDAITNLPGSFQRTMDGIAWLRKYNVRFSLKTILMTVNVSELENMRALAHSLSVEFRYDTLVSPRTDGGMSPVKYRLAPATLAAMDIDNDYESCEKIFSGFWNKNPSAALMCGAGVFSFNINPYGILSPCTMFQSFQYPLKGARFMDVWKQLIDDFDRERGDFIDPECASCSMLLICSNCPAWSEIETKSLNKKVDFVCEYAKCLEKKYLDKKGGMYEKETVSETGYKRG
jgi:MoaA/NifB/PqqE/SkfB family radical SAM enzyme